MTNMTLINEAVKLVIDLFEAEGITELTSSIEKRAIDWYEKTGVSDAEMLAAATITGSYQVGTSWNDMLKWKEFYFPSTSIEETIARTGGYYFDEEDFHWLNETMEDEMLAMENFHIGEIEASMKDEVWR